MARVSVWLGAGVLSAGVSAAVIAGAGAANADSDGGSDTGAASTTTSSGTHGRLRAESPQRHTVRSNGEARRDARRASRSDDAATDPKTTDPKTTTDTGRKLGRRHAGVPLTTDATDAPAATPTTESRVVGDAAVASKKSGKSLEPGELLGPFQPDFQTHSTGSSVQRSSTSSAPWCRRPTARPSCRAPLRDSVQVSTSKLELAPGTDVPADWYVPTTGQPERLIYLQHGYLASSPMYSYTAAYLAERTNSIVVATTLTSNPYAVNGMWLGGDNMHKAVAQLLLDENRTALNASLAAATHKIGHSTLTVPIDFVLVGHSLGGGFAPGVAGHYAEGLVARREAGEDGTNHLAGAVLLDGVPFAPITPNAMDRLNKLEQSSNGDPADYVPIYELGAPLNFLNAPSHVNEELTAARPGKFNGVVVNGGVHMDGMLGGNPIIQFSAYLVAGFPEPQNPPAVQLLMAGWVNDMFDHAIDPTTGRCLGGECAGQYGNPGDTIIIATDKGDASAVVIDSGALPAAEQQREQRFQPLTASSVVLPDSWRRSLPLRNAG